MGFAWRGVFSFSTGEGAPRPPACLPLWTLSFPHSTPSKCNSSAWRASATLSLLSEWDTDVSGSAPRRIREWFSDPDGDPIAPPALLGEGGLSSSLGPRPQGTGGGGSARIPARAHPRGGSPPARYPLTPTPPAAAAATVLAAPPRAGHVAPGHAEPLSGGGADSAG